MTVKNQLSADDIAAVQEARRKLKAGATAGVQLQEETKYTATTHDTFIPIDGLPSKGLFYPTEIYGQPLKVEDLILIQTMSDSNLHKTFSEIFSRRIKGINPLDILVGDEIYLALWLRANSYPGYNFPHEGFICQNTECGVTVPSDSAEFGFMDMDFDDPLVHQIQEAFKSSSETEVTLKQGTKVKIALKRRKHIARIQSILKRDYYDYNQQPPIPLVFALGVAAIVSFDDCGTDLMDIVNRIQSLSAIEYADLHNYIKKYSITSDPTVRVKCPVCGEVSSFSGYTFRPEIYIPTDI